MKTLISGLAVAAGGLLLLGSVARGAELPRADKGCPERSTRPGRLSPTDRVPSAAHSPAGIDAASRRTSAGASWSQTQACGRSSSQIAAWAAASSTTCGSTFRAAESPLLVDDSESSLGLSLRERRSPT